MKKIDRIPDTGQQWYKDAKYGLFIHWGLYAILAGEYKGQKTDHISEWIMNTLNIPVEEYEKLAGEFCPERFCADGLVRMAKESWGMKYIVFTSKHHEGFAMYHSKCSPYNVVDATPCGRDILKELADACHKYGMKLGLYYSQAQDWHEPDGYMANTMMENEKPPVDNDARDFQHYLDNKVKPQLKELLTGYGEISLIWFDTPMGMTREQSMECISLVKSLQPDCIISGRIGNQLGDYTTTGDNFIPRLPFDGDWELPATLNDTWGYNKDDNNWKEPEQIIRTLVKICSRGGNYLLNAGPRADGSIPEKSVEILNAVGQYLHENGEGIYETQKLGIYPYELDWGEFTGKPHRMFIHVFKPCKGLGMMNLSANVKKAYLLRDGSELAYKVEETCEGDSMVTVELPQGLRKQAYYCVCLEIEEEWPVFEPLRG